MPESPQTTPAPSPTGLRRLIPHRFLQQSKTPPAAPPSHFPQIDVLRGIAATTVVVYHVIELAKWESFPTTGWLASWCRIGWMSVPLFYVISGFVITLSAVRLYRANPQPIPYARAYLRRRFARIVPLHYATCMLFLVMLAPAFLAGRAWPWQIATHALFIHNLFPDTQGALNGANWSLGVEMQFYLLVMLLTPWLARTRAWKVVLAGVAVSWLWRGAVFLRFHAETHPRVNLTWLYSSQLPGALDLFAAGAALALILDRPRKTDSPPTLLRPLIWGPLAAAAGFVVLGIYWTYASYWDHFGMVTFWMTGLALLWALTLATTLGLNHPTLVRLTAPLRYLGTISYGLYLWHLLVIVPLLNTSLARHPKRLLITTLVLTTVLASASWHLFEKPALERWTRRRSA